MEIHHLLKLNLQCSRSSKLEPIVTIDDRMPKLPDQPNLPTFWAPVDVSQAAFVAMNAVVMGHVSIESGVSIWYGAVVRGDVERIEIGKSTNIQDGAIIHGDPGQPTILESYVTVGHRAVIHSAYIETGCLIGIGAIVLDGVRVGKGSIIGAGCVVTKDVPPRSLMLGVPAKCLRQIEDDEAEGLILHARKYEQLALVHAGTGKDLGFTPFPLKK